MGYYSSFSGSIAITPPLSWREIRDTPWIREDSTADFRIEVQEEIVDTDDGQMTAKRGVAVVPWQEDPYKGYNAPTTLGEIVKAFPGHEFSGEIRVEGEDAGDIWRLVICDGKPVRENAEVVWPDGTKAGGR